MNLVFPELSGQEQAEAVKQTEEEQGAREPAAGDAHYAVSNKWFTQWCQHTGFAYDPAHKRARVEALEQPGPRPGPIDNSDLLAQPPSSSDLTEEQRAGVAHLRQHLEDRRDFWVLSEPTWNLLKEWYGCSGPEVRREYHTAGKRLQLDAHQMHFRAMAAPGGGQGEREAVVGASPLCTVGDLKDMACRALGIEEPQQWALWDYAGQKAGGSLELSLHKTLPGAKLADQQALLLAPKPPKQEAATAAAAAAPLPVPGALPGTPPSPTLLLPAPGPLPLGSPLRLSSPRYGACSPTSPLARSFDRAPAWAEDVVSESAGRSHGLAGLGNLGNTCFMNSSLQCLAHTPPLMQTFLSEAYRRDLNKDNPLSLGGKLALAFGALMGKLWQGGVASVSPKLFKWQLAKFAPQFSGYAQQDSQELLAFLLDGLHEDLNRITDKPYIEDKDAEGRPDEEVAAEAWTNYRRRNDSVIVDAFQGLYRSVLTCPDCNFHSVKFDPFMYLSLPLPSSKMRAITFTAVYVDGSAPPCRYGIEVPRSATLGQLYSGMAELVGLPPGGGAPEDRLLLTQFNLSSGDSAVYSDLKARVSGIEDLRSRFSIHRSSPHYVLFVYPSAEEGPRAPDARTVLVYHKTKGYSSQTFVIPATPLFVPGGAALEAELACNEADGGDTLVAHPRVQAQLRALLRPCRKHPEQEEAEEAPAPAAPEAANGPSSGSPVPMDAAPASEGAAAEPGASAAGEGDGEAMDVEQPQQAQQAEQQQQQDGHQDVQQKQQQQEQQQQQDGDTFDMWAPQKEDARKAAEAAAAAAASQPPYLLKLAKKSNYGSGVSTYDVKPADALKDGEPLILLAEWQSAAEQLYDPKPLLLAEQHASAAALAERQRDGGKSVGLVDCLETFLQPEQLDADDCWYCSKCKKHVQADKKLDLWSLPDVLVIHLKRFSYSRYSRDKLDTLVDFPLTGLDMAPYLLPKSGNGSGSGDNGQGSGGAPVYDCFAVSNHYGGMGGGHYTAYCRVPGTAAAGDESDLGHWYTFDDSHVGKMEASGVRTAAAYVLFYRRRGSCAVDVDALLAQRAAAQRATLDMCAAPSGQQQQQQQAAAGAGPAAPAASPAADASMLDSQEALEAASQEAAAAHGQPPPPPPLPGSSGSLGSMLGKRAGQPDTIDEELEEDSRDELAPAAGGMPIDLD